MQNYLASMLVDMGWNREIAREIAVAYFDNGLEGVKKVAEELGDSEHDYLDEVVENVNRILEIKHQKRECNDKNGT